MASFNLVDECWIPCRKADGDVKELSLRDALVWAHELREVWDASPLVTVTLHRLLLAVVHRCFGPENDEAWKQLWKAGRLDAAPLDAYFQSHRDRFDLFHPRWPFYQVPRMSKVSTPGVEVELHPVQVLAQEAASGNNATLFDHNRKDRPRPMHPAEAARYLLARQGFSLGGGHSEPFYFSDGTLARGYTVMAEGSSLFETLMLNLFFSAPRPPIPRRCEEDLPAWEQSTARPPDSAGTEPCGYLDYLTLLSRRIHLIADGDGLVRYCQVQQNLFLPKGLQLFDPFKAYRRDKQAAWTPRKFQRERALWRDCEALFEEARNTPNAEAKRPELFEHLAWINEQRQEGKIAAEPSYGIRVCGMATQPTDGREKAKAASVIFWRHERLPLPLAYLNDERLYETLRTALRAAEDAGRVIGDAVRRYATLMFVPNWDRLDKESRQNALSQEQTTQQIRDFARTLRPGLWYWPRLEETFRTFLVRLPDDRRDVDGEVMYGDHSLTEWARSVRSAAREAFAAATGSTGTTPRSRKAGALAEEVFRRGIGRAMRGFGLAQEEDAA